MSTFRNPVGPQKPAVYWRRRLIVALGVVAVVVAIALIVFLPRAATTGTDPSSSASVGTGDETGDDAAVEDPAPSTEPVAGAPCDPAAVTVTAATDSNSYAADQQPQLSFAITNIGTVSCTFNVGTTQQAFVITSGEEQYWSSKDCETGPVDAELTLEPNVASGSTPIAWDRTRSSPDTCEGARAPVPAGGATYNLAVTVGAVPVSTTSFILN